MIELKLRDGSVASFPETGREALDGSLVRKLAQASLRGDRCYPIGKPSKDGVKVAPRTLTLTDGSTLTIAGSGRVNALALAEKLELFEEVCAAAQAILGTVPKPERPVETPAPAPAKTAKK